jgi:hypothetical protein
VNGLTFPGSASLLAGCPTHILSDPCEPFTWFHNLQSRKSHILPMFYNSAHRRYFRVDYEKWSTFTVLFIAQCDYSLES